MEPKTLGIWKSFASKPGGKWAFSRLICLKAPYFGSIKPLFVELRPEYSEVHIKKRRAVLNHIGTVHAIAMCNMAELAAGVMTDVTIPPTHRWIPKGMTVRYLEKAESNLRAIAIPASPLKLGSAGEYAVNVDVVNTNNIKVFTASITMWVSPKR
ncbi:MAG: DUF4442 domain-containing protein [Candidatus Competibacteraceae bacterium]|nr:DUF4442 domain-containing protein [Candidatus Competibacteraceae bacterium]